MISAIDITKTYSGHKGTIPVLDGISFQVAKEDFVAVVGRSGTGKSTLLGVTGGLLKPSRGEVFFDGQSLWDLDEQLRAQIRAKKIGFVFQNASVIGSLSVLENILLPQTFLPEPTPDNRAHAMTLLESLGLGHKAHDYPDQLSGGEKRRVAIASALMNDPALLLADEPTGDLDSQTETEIMSLFSSLWQKGTTIIMVTHHPQITRYANRIFTMNDGLITETSGPSPARNSYS